MDYSKILKNFSKTKVLVIGDVILDRFWMGEVSRISPEAPVPVVSIGHRIDTPGGAANVAMNITSLGGKAWLCGCIGNDQGGKVLRSLLKKSKVQTSSLVVGAQLLTIEKTRIIGAGQHIVRIDNEKHLSFSSVDEDRIIRSLRKYISSCDVIAISDYAKGFLSEHISKEIIRLAKFYKKYIIADTKPEHLRYFNGVNLMTPNQKEAFEMSGVKDIEKACRIIHKQTGASVLATLGSKGMILFNANKFHHILAHERRVFDVVGAGDTVVATLALCMGSHVSLEIAAEIANKAAAIVVSKPGTATVTPSELKE